MIIDKPFLVKYLLKSKENAYLLELYKIYELCSKITNNNILKRKKILDSLEDKIYTINGKVLSQKERVALELKRIIKEFSKCQNEKVKNDIAAELNALIIFMDSNESDTKKYYAILKQKIAVIEAKLNININFFYAASMAFLDRYESEFISSKSFISDDNIAKKIYNDKYELIKDNNNFKINNIYNNNLKIPDDFNNFKKGDKK